MKQMLAELATLGPGDRDAREVLVDKLADALDMHTKLEEELFYPAHTTRWERSFKVLRQAILRHIDAEEMALFADAERLGDDELERLGETIRQRSEALRSSLGQRALRKLREFGRKTA